MDEKTEQVIAYVVLASFIRPTWFWLKSKLADPGEEKQSIRYILGKKAGRAFSKLARKGSKQPHRHAAQ